MVQRLKEVDVVVIGVGMVGSIVAKELAAAGYKVVGLERGQTRFTYDDLEPHYDRFEYLLGTSGKAGNIKGQIQAGGDPHESPRSREYPTPPQKEHFQGALFRKAANSLGYHPFPQPSSNLSQPYTNPEGVKLNACVFCGFCERYACEHYAKSVPQTVILPVLLKNPNFE